MSTPPGWFPNPTNHDEEVYWDGDRWTGDSRKVFGADGAGSNLPVGEDPSADLSDLDGPETNSPQPGKKRKSRRRLWISLAAVVLVLVVGGVTVGVITNNVHVQQVAAHKAAEKKKADAERKAEAAASAKQAADDAERASRAETVKEVEASVKKMAEDDISKELLEGPVIAVACNPVGGSTDDLTDTTTKFDCFVANKDNGDGTQSGYFFNSTVNWSSGQYTYGIGKSGS